MTGFFMWVLRLNLGPRTCPATTLLSELSLSTHPLMSKFNVSHTMMLKMLMAMLFCVSSSSNTLSIEKWRARSQVCDQGVTEKEAWDEVFHLGSVGSHKQFRFPFGNANIYCPQFYGDKLNGNLLNFFGFWSLHLKEQSEFLLRTVFYLPWGWFSISCKTALSFWPCS